MGALGDPSKTWMEAMHAEEDALSPTKTSKAIQMIGGVKYHMKLMVFHSVHNEHDESKESYAKLKWESDKFFPQLVPGPKMYKGNKSPPLKITGYFKEDLVLVVF